MVSDSVTEREQNVVLLLFLVAACFLHVAAGLALGFIEQPTALAVAPTLAPVEFTPIEPEPAPMDDAPPEPVPAVEPEPEPEPEPVPVRRERPAPRAAEPDPAPPPAAETIEDFSGTTLVGGSGGFAVAQGSGAESDRIGRPNARVTGRNVAGVQGGVPGGTGATTAPTAVADLRQRPQYPASLRSLRERNNPREARAQSIEAYATARIVILADGTAASIRITRESVPGFGFGAACRRALEQAGRWTAPVGRDGRPTSTTIPAFRCEFEIR